MSPAPLILAGDIGGTNLNLALMVPEGRGFRILAEAHERTQAEHSLLAPIRRLLVAAGPRRATPHVACISGAGPVRDNRLELTNAGWDIDGAELTRELGCPVHVLNDFAAVTHGVVRLDPADGDQLLPLPQATGRTPRPDPQGLALVVGAGTGLGVGFATREGGRIRVFPSEGGHIGLPLLDEDSLALWRYLRTRFPAAPGAEAAVSGMGIQALFSFLVDTGRVSPSPEVEAILALAPADRPAAIALGAEREAACTRTMELFIDLYGRVCAELCAAFLPAGGLYLAGGIAAKNASRFLAGDRFMRSFARNYRPHLDELTAATPVFIVRDYALSLHGAAHAALALSSSHPV